MSGTDAPWLDCEVVCDSAPRPLRRVLRLGGAATVATALQAAREAWPDVPIDWASARVGVWGVECQRERPLLPGDRVELYRPLPQDPREARRRRSGGSRR